MKAPKPTEGSARHCWGKRRRRAKKLEKGIWKALGRLGVLQSAGESAATCSWEERGGWGKRTSLPYIAAWSGPSYGCDDWSEWPVSNLGFDRVNAPAWTDYDHEAMGGRMPDSIAKSSRHALQLLRQEIRARKHRHTPIATRVA